MQRTSPDPVETGDGGAARTRRRLPAFHPLPCARHDGRTAARQADFIGMLAETRSVAKAARAVAMGPVSYTHLTLPTIYSV